MTITIYPMDAAMLVIGLYGQIPLLKPRQVKRIRTLIVKIESAARAEAAAVNAYTPPSRPIFDGIYCCHHFQCVGKHNKTCSLYTAAEKGSEAGA